jgi:hypothetical protein
MVGPAFALDGTNRYVQIPDSPALKPTNLTVICWVRFSSLNSAGNGAGPGQQYLIFKQNSRSENFEGFDLSKDRTTSDFFTFRVTSSAGEEAAVASIAQVSTNVWYHVAAVRGPNFIQLYVNGQLEAQTNVGFPQDYGNLPMYFGTSGEPFFDRRLAGSLDEVALYNRALTPAEIHSDYTAGAAGKCKVPTILIQPQGGTRYWNSSITFTSAVAGALPLNYQWQKDGLPLAAATYPSLALTNLFFTNAGAYTLLATNVYSSATSSPAILSVKFAELAILRTNGSAALLISGLSNQTYGIQYCSALGQSTGWFGLANITLTSPTNVWKDPETSIVRARFYRLVPGAVSIPPRILTQPQGADLYWGGSVTLTSAVAGDLPLRFQWQKDGAAIIGATNSTLTLTNLQTTNTGVYSLLATNSAGSASSLPALINVRVPDLALTRTNSGGQNLAILTISGAPGVTYGIQFSENLVTWTALTNLTLTTATNSWYDFQGGPGLRYYRVVPGPILAPGALPWLVTQPQSATRYWGSSITFTSAASGILPLFYQWQKGGASTPGATTRFLNLTNLQMTDGGQYTILVTNMFGTATSETALLNVKVADYKLALVTPASQLNPMLTIAGIAGQTYKIQSSPSILQSNSWTDATNLTLTAATNYWFDPQPAIDANRYYRVLPGSPWEWSDIGAVWSDDFNRATLGTNWIVLGGANPTIVSNQLLLDYPSVNLSRQIYYDPWYINSDAWTIRWSQRFAALNPTSYGIGVGIKNFQAAGGNDRGYNGIFSGAGTYLGRMNIQRYDGSQHVLITSGPAIPVAAGDLVDCSLTRSGWTIIATASNRANAQVSSTSLVFSDPANLLAPTISRVCIYPFQGTVYLDDLSFTINRRKPARFIMIGASMGEGYNASDYSKTFISIVQSNFPQAVCNESSSYNTTTNSISVLPEILAHRPQTAILMIGGNDIQFGYPTNQWQSQYSSLVAQLQTNGVHVKHCLNPPRTFVNLLPLKDWITANYPASDLIDTWTPLLTGTNTLNPAYDSGDGVHPNDAGHLLIGTIISTNLP